MYVEHATNIAIPKTAEWKENNVRFRPRPNWRSLSLRLVNILLGLLYKSSNTNVMYSKSI